MPLRSCIQLMWTKPTKNDFKKQINQRHCGCSKLLIATNFVQELYGNNIVHCISPLYVCSVFRKSLITELCFPIEQVLCPGLIVDEWKRKYRGLGIHRTLLNVTMGLRKFLPPQCVQTMSWSHRGSEDSNGSGRSK